MTGCNTIGDIAPTDASVNDVVKSDAALGPCATDQPPVMKYLNQQGVETDGDWSCYDPDAASFFPLDLDAGDGGDAAGDDASDAVAPDADVDAGDGGTEAGPAQSRFHLTDFVNLTAVPGAQVDLFFHNALGTPDFQGVTADLDAGDGGPNAPGVGEFLFPPSGTPLVGYRINGPTSIIRPLIWLDIQAVPANQTLQAQSISPMSFDLLAGGIVGTTPIDPMKMGVVVGARDCRYRDVLGGIVELIDDTTGQPLVSGENDFRAAYFGPNGFPEATCKHTVAQQALYTAVNVPVDRPISARVRGRMRDSDTSTVILGTRKLPAVSGFIVIVRPYRLTP